MMVYILAIGFILLIVAAIWHCISLVRQAKEGCTFLDLKFNRLASKMLCELAERRKTSKAQVLRDGMVLLHWCEEKDKEGKEVRLEVTNKATEEPK